LSQSAVTQLQGDAATAAALNRVGLGGENWQSLATILETVKDRPMVAMEH